MNNIYRTGLLHLTKPPWVSWLKDRPSRLTEVCLCLTYYVNTNRSCCASQAAWRVKPAQEVGRTKWETKHTPNGCLDNAIWHATTLVSTSCNQSPLGFCKVVQPASGTWGCEHVICYPQVGNDYCSCSTSVWWSSGLQITCTNEYMRHNNITRYTSTAIISSVSAAVTATTPNRNAQQNRQSGNVNRWRRCGQF